MTTNNNNDDKIEFMIKNTTTTTEQPTTSLRNLNINNNIDEQQKCQLFIIYLN